MNTRNTLASVFVALLLVACGGGDDETCQPMVGPVISEDLRPVICS